MGYADGGTGINEALTTYPGSPFFKGMKMTQDEWDWNVVRFDLFNALNNLNIHEIYLIEKDVNVLSLSIIVENMDQIRPILRMKIIDDIIAKRAPELYRRYLFLYEIWTKKEWDMLPVKKFFNRVSKTF